MFKTVSELQAFIAWSKMMKIKVVQIDNVRVEFSELGFLPESDLKELSGSGGATTLAESEPTDPEEEEDLAFWSAN